MPGTKARSAWVGVDGDTGTDDLKGAHALANARLPVEAFGASLASRLGTHVFTASL